MTEVKHLTVLGSRVDGALDSTQLETFANPNVQEVKFVTEEVTAFCPVTSQPDLYTVTISYLPNEKCVESKSLKLYLLSFRDQGIFGEALAAKIADDLWEALEPVAVSIETVQQIRGGLRMTSTAVRNGRV